MIYSYFFAKLVVVALNIPVSLGGFVREYGPIKPGFTFDQAEISWNVENLKSCRLRIESRTDSGPWGLVESFPQVKTDSSKPVRSGQELYLRITASSDSPSTLRMLTVAFQSTVDPGASSELELISPNKPDLQADPTTIHGAGPSDRVLSLYLAHWSKTLGRRDLIRSPDNLATLHALHPTDSEIAAAAGSILGLRAYVSFFHSLSELKSWLELAPIWCDLAASETTPDSNHFTPALVYGIGMHGEVYAVVPDDSGLHRIVIPHADFHERWRTTGRRVLIVQPKGLDTPEQDPRAPVWVHFHFEPPSHLPPEATNPQAIKPSQDHKARQQPDPPTD